MTYVIHLAGIAFVFVAVHGHAAQLVRSPELVGTYPVQGVELGMSPRQAFDHLVSLGYRAGDIASYDAWRSDGIEFVRGAPREAEGESRVAFSRANGRLTGITETWSRPGNRFSAPRLIDEARRHFGIPEEDPGCRALGEFTGNCRVQDAEDPEQVDLVFGLEILPGMLIRYIERRSAYRQL